MAKRESGANGSRTRGFMLAPPYAQTMEMQGGGERRSIPLGAGRDGEHRCGGEGADAIAARALRFVERLVGIA